MIDPIDSLAFSIHANPGVYAVLVGSGISRSAKIPTGWEITLELVRKWAAIIEEDCGDHPEEWYQTKTGKEPDYSEILDGLAKTPAARQQLLKSYWEPNEQEREDGAKMPTPAHRAIAELASKGFIRVIVTTNFDRLIETALSDVGITPSVLSTPDQIHGALPLVHTACTVVKVHGDYLDTRIRNTPEELAAYSSEFDTLLDQIFDQFGLITCGWSADWDVALRAAITRAPSRRYAMYWASRGAPGSSAKELITNRQGIQLPINDADSFFSRIVEKVKSLEEFSRPHPLSTEVAVASLKRFMSEDKYRIRHEDLVVSEASRTASQFILDKFPAQVHQQIDGGFLTHRVRSYEAQLTTILSMAAQGGYWATTQHYRAWVKAFTVLASTHRADSGISVLLELQKYPASLLFYTLAIGAVENNNFEFLRELCEKKFLREHRDDELAVQRYSSGSLLTRIENGRLLEGMDRRYVPLSDWMHDFCRQFFLRLIPQDNHYTYIFDKLEVLLALCYGKYSTREPAFHWAPPGAYGYRHQNRNKILSEIESSLAKLGNSSVYVQSGLFGESSAACEEQIEKLKVFVSRLGWY